MIMWTPEIEKVAAAFADEKKKRKRTALQDNQFTQVDPSDIDFEFGSPNKFFGTHVNLIPLQSAVAGPRLFYGARFYNQALPVEHSEAPLVQALADDDPKGEGRSFDDIFGGLAGAIRTSGAGHVVAVTPDEIQVLDEAGKANKFSLYNRFPFNRKTSIHNTAVVKIGDHVKPGQLLAKSNYTDDNGTLALGVNARVGLIPYKGRSMDDAIVVSESFAKRLTSQHLYGHDLDYKRGVRGGKAHYVGIFPQKFTKAQLDKLDEDGVIKPGQELQPGDPIILATKPRVISSQSSQLGLLSKHMRNARSDAVVTWDKDLPGVAADVRKLRSTAKVNVETRMPTTEGDKIVFRSGNKGIISCYDDQTEILTSRGWLLLQDLRMDDEVASLVGGHGKSVGKGMFVVPEKIAHMRYRGLMYGARHEALDYLVTDIHRMYCRIEHYRDKIAAYQIRTAKEAHQKRVYHLGAAEFNLRKASPEFFDLPKVTGRGRQAALRFPRLAFYEFMGWYLAEGCLGSYNGKGIGKTKTSVTSIKILISQSRSANPEKCRQIEAVLNRLGVKWWYSGAQYAFSNKALYAYLKPLGLSHDKRIPRELFQATREELLALVKAAWEGDGDGKFFKRYTTVSKFLADSIQEVLTLLGYRAVVRFYPSRKAYRVVIFENREIGYAADKAQSYYTQQYDGFVHCVQVPSGIVFVRRNGKAMWCGNTIIPDEHMPRTTDGKPLEVLLNPLSIPSRVNNSVLYELLLSKVAAKTGKPYKLSGFNQPGEKWYDFVQQELQRNGVPDTEEVFDPVEGKKLENPVTVGIGHVLKLHHTAESKMHVRGTGAYTADQQPLHGSGVGGGAKRLSVLETHSLMSSGAYNFLREGSTLRGQRNDEYWRMLRQGYEPREPGRPFVWDKFHALLNGAGYYAKSLPDGVERLQFWTDRDLDRVHPKDVKTGDLVDIGTMEPIKGGLFDDALTGTSSWGQINLPFAVPNPAAEDVIRKLLGLTEKQFRSIISGEAELPEHLRMAN